MTSSVDESNNERDPRLTAALRALSLPEPPQSLESCVQRRLRRRRVSRAGLATGFALALVVGLFMWQQGNRPSERVVPVPIPAQSTTPPQVAERQIPSEELDVLFAPPPVDGLTILDHQNRGFVAVLNRLEEPK